MIIIQTSFVNLTQSRVTLEERISIEELSLSNCLVDMSQLLADMGRQETHSGMCHPGHMV